MYKYKVHMLLYAHVLYDKHDRVIIVSTIGVIKSLGVYYYYTHIHTYICIHVHICNSMGWCSIWN